MLNTKGKKPFGVNESGDNLKENMVVPSHIKSIIDNFLKQIVEGANELLSNTNEQCDYITQVPGFVKTMKSINQKLHVDLGNVIMDDPYHSLIIHIPLSLEGMWLRLGKINKKDNDKEIKHSLVHIPFRSGIVLPYTQ